MKSIISDEGNGLIFTVLADSEDAAEVHAWIQALQAKITEVFSEHGPVRVLTDLTNITFTQSNNIRKRVAEGAMH